MSTTAKALIITWVIIGFLIVGGVGFYVGRTTAPKQEAPPFLQGQMNQPSGFQGGQQGGSYQQQLPQPSGTMQPPPGGMQQPGGSYQQPR